MNSPLPQQPILKHPQLTCSSLSVTDPASHPYKTDKITVLCIFR